MELTFNLTVEEANTVLGGLAKLPFEVSSSLISKIQKQAQAQMEPTAVVKD